MIFVRQSTAQTEKVGPFLDKTDGVTEEVALGGGGTEISKDGAAFGAGPVLGTHDAEGWYPVALTTDHTDTLGSLVIKSHAVATHLPVWHSFQVIPQKVYDSLVLGSDNLEVDKIQDLGSASAALVGGRLDVNVGAMVNNVITAAVINAAAFTAAKFATDSLEAAAFKADAIQKIADAILPKKNTALSNIEFLMVASADHITPKTGLTVTGTMSIDAAAFVAVNGTIAEVADGIYQFDASADDMNGTIITFRFISAGADDTFLTIKTGG